MRWNWIPISGTHSEPTNAWVRGLRHPKTSDFRHTRQANFAPLVSATCESRFRRIFGTLLGRKPRRPITAGYRIVCGRGGLQLETASSVDPSLQSKRDRVESLSRDLDRVHGELRDFDLGVPLGEERPVTKRHRELFTEEYRIREQLDRAVEDFHQAEVRYALTNARKSEALGTVIR